MSHAGKPALLHPTTFVAPGAVVLGDVRLEARSSVWFNTVIRGDSAAVVVGEDTNVQDNSVVHEDEGLPTVIGSRVTVGHRAIIHGCVIEDDCLIGMGSVILSGARIGTGSLIGAASLVREHQTIPAGSLVVGSPARVLGPVSEEHRAAIRNGSTHYAELARSYMMRGLARGADASGAVTHTAAPMTVREWSDLLHRLQAGPWSVAEREGLSPAALRELANWDRARSRWIESVMRESTPPVMEGPTAGGEEASGTGAFDAWKRARADLLARLELLGPAEWIKPLGHPTRGARTVGDWLREWVDQDLERGRRLVKGGGARA